jgi:hypothetical protein
MPANANISEIIATTMRSRSKQLSDNVTKNNALLTKLREKGNIRYVTGGSEILEEMSYQENSNVAWYSGYDPLSVAAQEGITAAQFSLKQLACALTVSGLEKLQNSGKEQMIDLIASRARICEATMTNTLAASIYSAGTGYGGKELVGLGGMVVASPATGTVGGIDRASNTWWRNQATGSLGAQQTSTIQANMNTLYNSLVRGKDSPDLIVYGNALFGIFEASLQALQRFTDSKMAQLGFTSYKFKGADVVLDGGIGGNAPANVGYFLNTDYLFLRPHRDRDMVPLGGEREAVNQDASTKIWAWAGALTSSGLQYQGYFQGS